MQSVAPVVVLAQQVPPVPQVADGQGPPSVVGTVVPPEPLLLPLLDPELLPLLDPELLPLLDPELLPLLEPELLPLLEPEPLPPPSCPPVVGDELLLQAQTSMQARAAAPPTIPVAMERDDMGSLQV